MSFYSDIGLHVYLTDAMPAQVLEALKYLVLAQPEALENAPDHPFFQEDRSQYLLRTYDGRHELVHQPEDQRYLLDVASYVNYAYAPLKHFLDWISPYVLPQQPSMVLGFFCDEEGHGEILTIKDGSLHGQHSVLQDADHVRTYTSCNETIHAYELKVLADGSARLTKLDGRPFPAWVLDRGKDEFIEELLDELPASLLEPFRISALSARMELAAEKLGDSFARLEGKA
jgi:hypothetical protein